MKYKIQLVNVFGGIVDESVRPLDAEEAINFIRAYESISKPAVEQSLALDAPPESCEHGNLRGKCPVEVCVFSKPAASK